MGEVRFALFVAVIFKEAPSRRILSALGDRPFEHLGDQGGNRRAL